MGVKLEPSPLRLPTLHSGSSPAIALHHIYAFTRPSARGCSIFGKYLNAHLKFTVYGRRQARTLTHFRNAVPLVWGSVTGGARSGSPQSSESGYARLSPTRTLCSTCIKPHPIRGLTIIVVSESLLSMTGSTELPRFQVAGKLANCVRSTTSNSHSGANNLRFENVSASCNFSRGG